MVPIAVEPLNIDRDGFALEKISDDIDAVNVLKADIQRSQVAPGTDKDLEKSKFDAEKDKAQFRQYEKASDRVKSFYREQHQKQTVAYNLKARNDFKSKTRG